MKIITAQAIVFNSNCSLELMEFENEDRDKLKELFTLWKNLKLGLRDYKCREPNLNEGISEVSFCLYTGSKRLLSLKCLDGSGIKVSSSFDTFNLESGRAEQIKASSVQADLTSFGPKSRWDDLYFLDFYNGGKLDGSFNIYLIPNDLIYKHKMNAIQTFHEQQMQGRRPRLSITEEIIKINDIKPLAADVRLW